MALEHLPRRALDNDLTLIHTAGPRSWILGLSGLKSLPPNEALQLRTPCVDTMAVRFPIDLIWLTKDGRVQRVDRGVAPHRVRVCLGARHAVECAAGQADAFIAALTGPTEPSTSIPPPGA